MNVLNINLPKAHFRSLIELVNSGHTVYTNFHDSFNYEPSFGIKYLPEDESELLGRTGLEYIERPEVVSLIADLIKRYDIDILQVCPPCLSYLHTHFSDKVKYIGPSEEVAKLEMDKLYSKKLARDLGIKVPETVKQGKFYDTDYLDQNTFPYIVKTSHIWQPACIFNSKEDQDIVREEIQHKWGIYYDNFDYYIEEYISDMIETNVFFTVTNGEYSITHTQEIIGENLNKGVQSNVWYFGAYIKPLKPEVDVIVRREAEKYLTHIAKMGGSWEGSFCGAYTSQGDWYFLETNTRPDIFNSTPTFMTGDEYLKGLTSDVSLFGKAWLNKNVQKLLITGSGEYPYHLHIKYDVAVPNNLEIIDDKYFVCHFGVSDYSGRVGTVIADHNIPEEFIKEIEETTEWKFNAEPSL